MQPDSPTLGGACLLAAMMFPVFCLLRHQIEKAEPEIKLPWSGLFWVCPSPTLRLHRDFFPRSFLRTALAELQASGFIQSEIDDALARAAK